MSEVVDNRIVEMHFNNADFEKNVAESMKTLKALKSSLDNLSDAADGFKSLSEAANKVDFTKLNDNIQAIADRMSTLGIAGAKVITDFTSFAEKKLTGLAKKTFGLIKTGGKNRSANIEKAKFQLRGLGVEWSKIAEDVDYGVSGTAYGLDSAARAASQLVASGVKFGDTFGATGNSPMAKALRGISGVAAMTQSSYDEIAHIFTTVAGQGKVMTMQLRQLENRGLNIAATLGESLGKSEQEIRDMVTKGKIDFKMFSDAMDDAFGEHAKDANKTLDGVLSNIRSALSRVGQIFIEPLIENEGPLVNFLEAVRTSINGIKTTLEPFAANTVKSLTSIINVGTVIVDYLRETKTFNTIVLGFLSLLDDIGRVLHPIVVAFTEVFDVLNIGLLNSAANAFKDFADQLVFSDSAIYGIYSISKLFATILKFVLVKIKQISKIIPPILLALGKVADVLLTVIGYVKALVSPITKIANELLFYKIIPDISRSLKALVEVLAEAAKIVGTGLAVSLVGLLAVVIKLHYVIIDLVKYGFNKIVNIFEKLRKFNFGKIADSFANLRNRFVDFIKSFRNANSVKRSGSVMTSVFSLIRDKAADAAKSFNLITNSFSNFAKNISGFVNTKFPEFVNLIKQLFASKFNAISNGFRVLTNNVKGFISSIKNIRLLDSFTNVFNSFYSLAINKIATIGITFNRVKSSIINFVNNTVNTVKGLISGAINPLELFTNTFNTLKERILSIENFKNYFTSLKDNLISIATTNFSNFINSITNIKTKVLDFISKFNISDKVSKIISILNSARTSIVNFSKSVSTSVKNLVTGAITPIEFITNSLMSLKNRISAIASNEEGFSALKDSVSEIARTSFSTIIGKLSTFKSNIVEIINGLEGTERFGPIITKIKTSMAAIAPVLNTVATGFKYVGLAIGGLSYVVISKIISAFQKLSTMSFDDIKSSIFGLKDTFLGFIESIGNIPVIASIKTVFTSTFQTIKNVISSVAPTFTGIKDIISSFISDLRSGAGVIESASNTITASLSPNVTRSAGGSVSGFRGLLLSLKDVFGGFVGAFADGAKKLDLTGILVGAFALYFTKSLIGLMDTLTETAAAATETVNTVHETVKDFKSVPNAIKGFFESSKAIPDTLNKTIASFEQKATVSIGQQIKYVAEAIALLAGSLWLLAQIPEDKLINAGIALGGITAAIAALGIELAIIGKLNMNANMLHFAAAMLAMAGAVLILSFALKSLSESNFVLMEAKDSLIALGLIGLGLAVISGILGRIAPNLTRGSLFLLIFAISVKTIANALIDLQNSKLEGADEALKYLSKIMLVLSVLVIATSRLKLSSVLGVLVMIYAISKIEQAIIDMASSGLTWDYIKSHIEPISIILLAVAAMSLALGVAGDGALKAGIALGIIMFMLTKLESFFGALGKMAARMNEYDFGLMIVGAMGIFGMMALLMAATGLAGKRAIRAAVGISIVSGVVYLISKFIIETVKALDINQLRNVGIGLALFSVVVALMVGITALTAKAKVTAILALSFLIGELVVSLMLLSVIARNNPQGMIAAGIALAGCMVGIAVMMFAASKLTEKIKTAPIIAMIGALAVAAAAMGVLAYMFDGDKLIVVAASLALVMVGLGAALALASNINWKGIVGIVLGTATLVVAAFALSQLAQFPWKQMIAAGIALGGVMLALGLALTLARFTKWKAIAGMVAGVTTLVAAGAALTFLATMPWPRILAAGIALGGVMLALGVALSLARFTKWTAIAGMVAGVTTLVAAGFALSMIATMPWEQIKWAGIALSEVLLALSAALVIAKFTDTKGIVGLVLGVTTLVAAGAALTFLATMPWEQIKWAGASLSLTLIALGAGLAIASLTDWTGIAGMVLGSIALAAVGASLTVLAMQPWEQIVAAAVSLNATLIILVAAIAVLGILGEAGVGFVGLGILAVGLIAVSAALLAFAVAAGAIALVAYGFAAAVNAVTNALMTLAGFDETAVNNIKMSIEGTASALANGIMMIGSSIVQTIMGIGSGVATAIVSVGGAIGTAAAMVIINFVKTVIAAISAAWAMISAKISAIGEEIKALPGKLIGGFIAKLGSNEFVSGAVNAASNIASKAAEALGGVPILGKVVTSASNFINGFNQTLQQGAELAAGAGEVLGNAAVEGLNGPGGIDAHSPSLKTILSGLMTVLGFDQGMIDNLDILDGAGELMASSPLGELFAMVPKFGEAGDASALEYLGHVKDTIANGIGNLGIGGLPAGVDVAAYLKAKYMPKNTEGDDTYNPTKKKTKEKEEVPTPPGGGAGGGKGGGGGGSSKETKKSTEIMDYARKVVEKYNEAFGNLYKTAGDTSSLEASKAAVTELAKAMYEAQGNVLDGTDEKLAEALEAFKTFSENMKKSMKDTLKSTEEFKESFDFKPKDLMKNMDSNKKALDKWWKYLELAAMKGFDKKYLLNITNAGFSAESLNKLRYMCSLHSDAVDEYNKRIQEADNDTEESFNSHMSRLLAIFENAADKFKANNDFTLALKEKFNDWRTIIAGYMLNYDEIVQKAEEGYKSSLQHFKKFTVSKEDREITIDSLIENEKSQKKAQEMFTQHLKGIIDKGGSQELIDHIMSMGYEQGYAYAKAIDDGTEEQIKELGGLFHATEYESPKENAEDLGHSYAAAYTEGFKEMFGEIGNYLQEVANGEHFGFIPEDLSNIMLEVAKAICGDEETARTALGYFNTNLETMFNTLVTDDQAASMVSNYAGTLASSFANGFNNKEATDALATATDGVTSTVTDAFLASLESNEGSLEKIEEIGSIVPFSFENGIVKNIKLPEDAAKTLSEGIVDTSEGIITLEKFRDISNNIIEGLKQGLYDGKDDVLGAIRDLCSDMSDTMEEETEIASPSKLFARFGRFIDLGLAQGISQNAGIAIDETASLAQRTVDSFNSVVGMINDILADNMDYNPSIVPVLDTTMLQNGMGYMNGLFDTGYGIGIGGQYADAVSASFANKEASEDSQQNPGNTYNFTQNNYSPKALSRLDIYRQTRNQFTRMKGVVEAR